MKIILKCNLTKIILKIVNSIVNSMLSMKNAKYGLRKIYLQSLPNKQESVI